MALFEALRDGYSLMEVDNRFIVQAPSSLGRGDSTVMESSPLTVQGDTHLAVELSGVGDGGVQQSAPPSSSPRSYADTIRSNGVSTVPWIEGNLLQDARSAFQVINEGQWLYRNVPISCFKWHVGFNPKGSKPTRIPVWVEFPDLSIDFYPWVEGLGKIIGRVLGQKARASGINPKWDPQVLIEVDVSMSIKTHVDIKDSDGLKLHT
ncbi:hypothetical protein KP509_27G018500 [Ceratopteris richardii]|uniref:DUF4283 domain-containing protein n=1 Tax=Ceratopteris richardii TaxID=49495 RepID=A0A8T2RE86_CERRI|nr:hypothetical protein KP509_27G018500 [Ceratopteris richardii]